MDLLWLISVKTWQCFDPLHTFVGFRDVNFAALILFIISCFFWWLVMVWRGSFISLSRDSAGFVYLRFEDSQGAINAQKNLHGRWFAGKMITATFMVYHFCRLFNNCHQFLFNFQNVMSSTGATNLRGEVSRQQEIVGWCVSLRLFLKSSEISVGIIINPLKPYISPGTLWERQKSISGIRWTIPTNLNFPCLKFDISVQEGRDFFLFWGRKTIKPLW